jgi:tripeptidyl-peptidase-1
MARYFAILTTLVLILPAPSLAAFIPRTPSSLQAFESLSHVPQGWTKLDQPAASTRLRLRIALQELDHALFEQTLFEISDPDHAKYGQHLKREEVKALIQPRNESIDAVMAWLQEYGVAESDIANDSEWINFLVPVSKAEEMMNTTFYYFTQDADQNGTKKIRTLQYSVPLEVAPHITMIQPTTRFGFV